MCCKILEAAGKLNLTEFDFLLKGGVVLDRQEQIENPCPTWVTDTAWDNLTELDKVAGFHGLTETFEHNSKEWLEWYMNNEPEAAPLVGEWNKLCNSFQKMLIVRSLRPDRISTCVRSFIVNVLGAKVIIPSFFLLKFGLTQINF